jgi:neurocalcin delta
MGANESKQSAKLSNADIEFLKAQTNYDEKTLRKKFRGFRHVCPSGCLTSGQFYDMYEKNFPGGNAEKYCNLVFKTFDTDQNGYIDFNEFLLATYRQESGNNETKLKLAFQMYDLDKNGAIDLQEMTNCIQAIYDMIGSNARQPIESAEVRAKSIFSQMDKNKDGGLTEEEFLQGCLLDHELSKALVPQ